MASWNAAAARCQFSGFPPFAHSASCASSPGIDEPTSSAISSNLFAASGVTIGGLMRILLSFAVFLRLFCSVVLVILYCSIRLMLSRFSLLYFFVINCLTDGKLRVTYKHSLSLLESSN